MHVMKKFIGYYKPYKKIFFIDMFCAMMISLIDLAFPQILNYLNDTLYLDTKEAILNSLLYLFIGLLIMYIVRAVCRFYVSGQGHIMGARMESDMRQDLFDHYEKLSFSYYDKNNTGEMMSRLVSDLFDISEFAHHGPENLFISSVEDYRFFCTVILYPYSTYFNFISSNTCYACFLLLSKQTYASYLYGQPP